MRYPLKRSFKSKGFEFTNLVSKFIKIVLKKGEKRKAIKIVNDTFKHIEKTKKKENVFFIFLNAVNNVSPRVKNVKKTKIQSDSNNLLYRNSYRYNNLFVFENFAPKLNYTNTIDFLFYKESSSLGLKILIRNSQKQKGRTFSERLASEIIDASENKGNSIKEKFFIEKEVFRKAEID